MKLKDILLESPTDVVARFYKEAGQAYDRYYNPEDTKYKEQNRRYYAKFFKEWFEDGRVPVFERPTTPAQPEYRNRPKPGQEQSPGYRGLQYTLAAAGLPYDHNVQRYEPNAAKMVAPQVMDGARNSNGQ